MSDAGCVLVLAPNWRGEAVMAVPAVADVRRACPSARVVVAARRAVAALFGLVPGVDDVVTLQWSGRWWQYGLWVEDTRRLRDSGWDGARPLVVFAPGAAYGTAKRWMPEYVARVATDLVRRRQATCVLVGSAGDTPTTREILAMMDVDAARHVIDLSGQTTIAELAGVLHTASACVANDSGAMHLAAAVGTPLVAIFGPTREHETAPLTRSGGRADVLTHPVSCRPCMLRECPIDHRCMKGITPERVYAAVASLLSSTT